MTSSSSSLLPRVGAAARQTEETAVEVVAEIAAVEGEGESERDKEEGKPSLPLAFERAATRGAEEPKAGAAGAPARAAAPILPDAVACSSAMAPGRKERMASPVARSPGGQRWCDVAVSAAVVVGAFFFPSSPPAPAPPPPAPPPPAPPGTSRGSGPARAGECSSRACGLILTIEDGEEEEEEEDENIGGGRARWTHALASLPRKRFELDDGDEDAAAATSDCAAEASSGAPKGATGHSENTAPSLACTYTVKRSQKRCFPPTTPPPRSADPKAKPEARLAAAKQGTGEGEEEAEEAFAERERERRPRGRLDEEVALAAEAEELLLLDLSAAASSNSCSGAGASAAAA